LNTAIGGNALLSNTTGHDNTAAGANALESNTIGVENSAFGSGALSSNTIGNLNTAVGKDVLSANTAGTANTAVGHRALSNNPPGSGNTAVGTSALINGSGNQDTAIGSQALGNATLGGNNTAVGFNALHNSTSGSNNIALGAEAGNLVTTASNVISIGSAGADVDDSCYIGNIWQQTGGSQAVYVNASGKLGLQVSSRRFKDEIKPIEQASEIIYGLKPVSFRYKAEIEPSRPLCFGLIAEEVERISPDLVTRGTDGRVNSVRYDAVNAMLLNEFLKEHRKNDQQEATIAELRQEIAVLTAGLQKVRVELEVSKSAPQTVLNNP
jgi:hypothetical protein